jgi:hypothetical protein
MATMETNIMVVAIMESETVEDAVNETITLDVRIILTTDVPGVMLRDVSTADLGPIHGIIKPYVILYFLSIERKYIFLSNNIQGYYNEIYNLRETSSL